MASATRAKNTIHFAPQNAQEMYLVWASRVSEQYLEKKADLSGQEGVAAGWLSNSSLHGQ